MELVVGDDRSDDETVDILRAFERTAPFPVRITVNDQRLHFSENFLRTASRCSGRYIAFCDQDDVWSQNKLQRCVEALEAADADFCGHDGWLIDSCGTRIGRHSHMKRAGVFPPLTLFPWGVFFGFSTLIRRNLLEAFPSSARGIDPVDPRRPLSHDRWAYFLGTTLGRTVYLDEPLVHYRQHGANTFGAGVTEAPLARIGRLMFTSVNDLTLHLDICDRRATMLTDASPETLDSFGTIRAGAVRWRRLAAVYQKRTALALDRSMVRRALLLAGLVDLGSYRAPAKGGLGLRAFAKDAFATVTSQRSEEPNGSSFRGVTS